MNSFSIKPLFVNYLKSKIGHLPIYIFDDLENAETLSIKNSFKKNTVFMD